MIAKYSCRRFQKNFSSQQCAVNWQRHAPHINERHAWTSNRCMAKFADLRRQYAWCLHRLNRPETGHGCCGGRGIARSSLHCRHTTRHVSAARLLCWRRGSLHQCTPCDNKIRAILAISSVDSTLTLQTGLPVSSAEPCVVPCMQCYLHDWEGNQTIFELSQSN